MPKSSTPTKGAGGTPKSRGPAIVLVTGANAGLGFFTAKTLITQQAVVLLGCRSAEASAEAKHELQRLTGCADEEQIVVLEELLDLADLASVRKYADAVKTWLGPARKLTGLVNNAGVGACLWGPRHCSSGNELCFSTNHLGHFLLTLLLLPVIAPSARIVNVSSEVHDPLADTPFPDSAEHWPTSQEEYDSVLLKGAPVGTDSSRQTSERHYSRSKLCNVLFSYELARRLSGAAPAFAEPEVADAVRSLPGTAGCSLPNAKQICVAAFNPGLMLDTNFVTSATGTITGWVFWAFTPIIRLSPYGHLLTTGPGSGAVLARLAIGELRSPTSTAVYFDKAQERPSSEFSRSRDGLARVAPELWAHSVRWAGLTKADLDAAGLGGGGW